LGMTQVVGCLEWQIAVHWLQVGWKGTLS
jgi:hypothetical protein